MPIDSAHIKKKKKNIPPAIGTGTKFNRIADVVEVVSTQSIASLFLLPEVRDRRRFADVANAPYVIADINAVF